MEAELRAMWTAQGVPVARQDAIIASVKGKAQAGAMVGPFKIAEDATPEGMQLVIPGCEKIQAAGPAQMVLF